MDISLMSPISSDTTFQPGVRQMEQCELERALERLHPETWGWALACCGREKEMAEEVLQNSYLRIISGRAKFGGTSSLKTWLFGVIRLTAREEIRRRKFSLKRFLSSRSLDNLRDESTDADEAVERVDGSRALIEAMASLSRRQQQVLQLVFYHGMTIEDAAGVMHISLGSARTHYERGKKALARLLTPGLAP
ncbi:MAG TPA: RNA polymerase sigma factor [Gemmatimonadaceae bacterium]